MHDTLEPLGPDTLAPRFHVTDRLGTGESVTLDEATARHVQALRLRCGDRVVLFNGDGHEYAAELIAIGKRNTQARIRERSAIDLESPLPIVLAQGVSAAERMDLVIQKATELGIGRIVPVITSRSIVRLSSERQERRETHWQNVAIAACEQCRRNIVPAVESARKFDAFIADPPEASLRIVLAADGRTRLGDLPRPASLVLFVGPEGGLSGEERELLEDRAFQSVRFGPRVLRTETAPIAALAAMQALWGDC